LISSLHFSVSSMSFLSGRVYLEAVSSSWHYFSAEQAHSDLLQLGYYVRSLLTVSTFPSLLFSTTRRYQWTPEEVAYQGRNYLPHILSQSLAFGSSSAISFCHTSCAGRSLLGVALNVVSAAEP